MIVKGSARGRIHAEQLTESLAWDGCDTPESAGSQFTRILRSITADLDAFSNCFFPNRLVKSLCFPVPKVTYNGGNVRIFHITASDRNRLDQELVLALLIGSRLLLHSLQQDYLFDRVSFAALGAYRRRISNLGHQLACQARYGRSWGGHSS